MEKRSGALLLVLFVAMILFSVSEVLGASITIPANGSIPDYKVCGQTPNSLIGYGQAILGNIIFTCDNTPDGICPEDYQDAANSSIYADCSSCTDPDCIGNITGVVKDFLNRDVDKATVTSHPVRYNMTAGSMETSATTDSSGRYIFETVTGNYYFSASKESFDTELLTARVYRNKAASLNFTLLNGTCHDDCTNSYGRCNAACDGMWFASHTTNCTFASYDIKEACNNRLFGTYVLISSDPLTGTGQFAKCCEGGLETRSYATATSSSTDIRDMVKIEKIARYNDVPVKIVIAYWPRNK